MKVGDRVKIVCKKSRHRGKEAVIWSVQPNGNWVDESKNAEKNATAYRVDIAGYGRLTVNGNWIAFERHELRPIQDIGSWDEIAQMCGFDIRQALTSSPTKA